LRPAQLFKVSELRHFPIYFSFVRNLFISHGSVLTTPGSANPTLTIVAVALLQAEYISQQMKAPSI